MKTYAPSSTKRLALANAMPLDPPVMTATLPSSFPMTSPFVVSDRPFGDGVDADMGPAASGVQCGSSHIGGAKSNQASESLRDDMRWSALRVYGNERRQGRHAAPFVRGRDAVRWDWTRALERRTPRCGIAP